MKKRAILSLLILFQIPGIANPGISAVPDIRDETAKYEYIKSTSEHGNFFPDGKRDTSLGFRLGISVGTQSIIDTRPKFSTQEYLVLSPTIKLSGFIEYREIYLIPSFSICRYKQENEHATYAYLHPKPTVYGLLVQQNGTITGKMLEVGIRLKKARALEILGGAFLGDMKFTTRHLKTIYLTSNGAEVELNNQRKSINNACGGINIRVNYTIRRHWLLSLISGIHIIDGGDVGIPIENHRNRTFLFNNHIGIIYKIAGK